ncbi:hypothetical protein DBV08_30730 [Rhodococcus sp. KBW08]|nr:hypothetical protein DBV08_30730 [Rhodococcus sp. KBW08]
MSVGILRLVAMTTCAVLGCSQTDIRPHALKETTGHEYPAETVLCAEHIAAVSDPSTDWTLGDAQNPLTGGISQAVFLGKGLHALNEFVIKNVEASLSSGSALQVDSPAATRGNYVTLNAHRRGDSDTTALRLLVPYGQEDEIAKQLESVADLLRSFPK